MEEFRWSALEYPHHERSVDWFWGLGIGAIIIAGISIYFDNALFAVLVLTGALAVGMFSIRKPLEIEHTINDKHVIVGDKEYRYSDLQSFYVSDRGHHHKLIFATKNTFGSYLIIPLYDHDPDDVRRHLLRKLPEVPHDEPLLHIVAERLGI